MNDDDWILLGALGLAGLVWWYLKSGSSDTLASDQADLVTLDFSNNDLNLQDINNMKTWTPPAAAAPYLAAIRSAESRYGLPDNLLARLLYQESHYRQDIITGKTRSSVGALGIAQFMPATAKDMGIDPLDPFQAIPAAAKYLKQLYNRFGAWDKALAAYNWGQGNVSKNGLAKAPTETKTYFQSILSDLGLA